MGPYILSFFVAEFVLIMQFMWKYIDEILGKGFSVLDILELIIYYGMMIVPMALPISILIASVMVFGNLAERYEMTSLKSAGMPLMRIMASGIALAFFTFLFSVFTSNYLKPIASFQFKKRFEVIRKQKSSLFIEEKVFNDDFNDFVIRVDNKAENDIDMQGVLMYDQSRADRTLLNMIKSDSARMFTDSSGRYFVMDLYNGSIYQEDQRKKRDDGTTSYPLLRTSYKSYHKVLDMSEFKFDEGGLDINRNKEDMLNTFQLLDAIDSLDTKKSEFLKNLKYDYHELKNFFPDLPWFKSALAYQKDTAALKLTSQIENKIIKDKSLLLAESRLDTNQSIVPKNLMENARALIEGQAEQAGIKGIRQSQLFDLSQYKTFRETIDSASYRAILFRASSIVGARLENALSAMNNNFDNERVKQMYLLRLFQQYSFAFICIVFMFIGAPLGSIIRKGGYGYPFLIAILFYMLFIITSIMGEKLTKNQTYSGFTGAWISSIILVPVAIYVTIKAQKDSKFEALQNAVAYVTAFIIKKFGKKDTSI